MVSHSDNPISNPSNPWLGMDVNIEEADIFDCLASNIRLQILRSLSRQPMNYSDLMKAAGMIRQRSAGRFAYHLKKLLAAELVKVNEKSKLYELSKRGKTILQYVDNLKDELEGSEMMIVRRTESAVEAFDRNKIVNVLISEAGMPAKLASHVALVAEEKLEGLKVEYLTGSLIRELVNSLLIDMGLEKYRHRLTRLGMPLHDVEKMLAEAMQDGDIHHILRTTSGAVMREYLLLNILPRKVGDMYLSGAIDLQSPEMWVHGVYARFYPDGVDEAAILDEVLCVSGEIGLEILDSSRRGLERALEGVKRLKAAGSTSHLSISAHLPHDFNPDILNRLRETGISNLIIPDYENRTHYERAEIGIGKGPITAFGYLYSPTKTIHGVASLNIPRAYLSSNGEESVLWDELEKAVEAAVVAMQKKIKSVLKFWRLDPPAHLIMAPCGMAEVLQKMGVGGDIHSLKDFVGRLTMLCERFGREGVRILISGGCYSAAAERFYKLDLLAHGRRSVMEITGRVEGGYSTSILDGLEQRKSWEAAAELAKHLTGGLSVRLGKGAKLEDAFSILRSSNIGDLYLILRNVSGGS